MANLKSTAIATAATLCIACAPPVPVEYAQECLRLVRETAAGETMHETTRPVWTREDEDGRGAIRFDFSHLAGEREVEYEYVSHYMHVGDVPIPIFATDTRTVEYGPRFRATCARVDQRVVLDGIEETGEWENSL
ncbi:MAG: hypothetical protein OXG72_06655 [Acidobacteria bacterium]|nr:hypothetical protein [Acidobacteriota bacterium]